MKMKKVYTVLELKPWYGSKVICVCKTEKLADKIAKAQAKKLNAITEVEVEETDYFEEN